MTSQFAKVSAERGVVVQKNPLKYALIASLALLLSLLGTAGFTSPAASAVAEITGTLTFPQDWAGDAQQIKITAEPKGEGTFRTATITGNQYVITGLEAGRFYQLDVTYEGDPEDSVIIGQVQADGSVEPRYAGGQFYTAGATVDIQFEQGATMVFQVHYPETWDGDRADTYAHLHYSRYGMLTTVADYTGLIVFGGLQANREYRLWLGQTNQTEVELAHGYIADNQRQTGTYATATSFVPRAQVYDVDVVTGERVTVTVADSDGVPLPNLWNHELTVQDADYGTFAEIYDDDGGQSRTGPLPVGSRIKISVTEYSNNEPVYTAYATADGTLVTDPAQAHIFTVPTAALNLRLPQPIEPEPEPQPEPQLEPDTNFAQVIPTADVSGDGIGDVLAVDHDGVLWLYRGKPDGAIGSAQRLGAGWGGLTVSAPGDFNRDGKADILAKAANGDLYFYPGKGNSTFGSRVKAGWNWGPYDIIPAGDVTGDGIVDVLAIDQAGVLYYYAGDGAGGFTGKLTKNGQGWVNVDLYPAGDLNGDGNSDILSIRKDGTLHTHLGRGDGGFSKSTQSGQGWAGYELFAGSDANRDGLADLYSRDSKNQLWFYAGKPGSGFRAAVKVGTGW